MPETTSWRPVRGDLDDDAVKALDSLIDVSEEFTAVPEAYGRDDDDRLTMASTIFDIAGSGVVGIIVRDTYRDEGAPEFIIAWKAVQ